MKKTLPALQVNAAGLSLHDKKLPQSSIAGHTR